jgi:hypothetical protein
MKHYFPAQQPISSMVHCRKQLFTQNNIIGHEFGAGQDAFKWHKRADPIAQKNKQVCFCRILPYVHIFEKE